MVAPAASYARTVTFDARSVATVREQDVSRSGLKAEKHGGAGTGAVGCTMTVSSDVALCARTDDDERRSAVAAARRIPVE